MRARSRQESTTPLTRQTGGTVAMATWQGQKMAELIAGGKPDNPFVRIPFPGAPLGLYNGNAWFSSTCGMYYKFLDWVS